MAGKYGSSSVTISLEDGPGGTARLIKNFILTMGSLKITANTQPSHAFGDTWEETLATGVMKGDAITLTGFWDTTATTGPHVMFSGIASITPQSDGREMILGYGDSKICTFDTVLVSYAVMGKNGNITEFEAVLQPTGTMTWS